MNMGSPNSWSNFRSFFEVTKANLYPKGLIRFSIVNWGALACFWFPQENQKQACTIKLPLLASWSNLGLDPKQSKVDDPISETLP